MSAPPPIAPKPKVMARNLVGAKNVLSHNREEKAIERPKAVAGGDITLKSIGGSPRATATTSGARPASLKRGYAAELSQQTEDSVGLTDITIETPAIRPPPPKSTEEKKSSIAGGPVKPVENTQLFKGRNLLQYALWAHYMSYGAAILCFFLGIFAIAWVYPINPYQCDIDGQPINELYFNRNLTINGTYADCNNYVLLAHSVSNKTKLICCYPDRQSQQSKKDDPIEGNAILGALYIVYALILLVLEDTTYGYGLYYRIDNHLYQYKVSLWGIFNIAFGAAGLSVNITILAGLALMCLGAVQSLAAYRQEAGDGGHRQHLQKSNMKYMLDTFSSILQTSINFRPYRFYIRIYNEDKLSSYIWVFIFLAANLIYFSYAVHLWYATITAVQQGLMNGTLDLTGYDRFSHMLRKSVRYGPPTYFAAWAKGFGSCLNMNCALLILPVIKLLLNRLNNLGVSFSKTRDESNYFSKFFASPFTRYVPLSKNIDFHKLCAGMILFDVFGHILMHYCNLTYASASTQALFRNYLHPSFPVMYWSGAAFFTGSVITFAMFIIYTAAPQDVRMAKFEMFFVSHHFFTIFYLFFMIHGPVTFYWTFIPVGLYLYERYLQTKRGSHSFILMKVEYIHPVMAVYFRPVNKKHFQFKEGQYLYLNCPYVSANEWHPFTISSALDDLNNGPRVDIRTGEEVMEVPRPKNLKPGLKWRKYCHVSEDWRQMDANDFLEKADTDYLDYVSVHIKVHGLDENEKGRMNQSIDAVTDTRRPWTRRVKDYLELLQPHATDTSSSSSSSSISTSATTAKTKFPFYFYEVDNRGEILVGKRNGPDGQPILRVDGPHSAPSEHYSSYGTLMIIGAGIGLTPCASILCALIKYRWKKNFDPEILHFYWIVRQSEVESFQWLVHMLTELSFELSSGQESNQIESKYYCEFNIYVTGVDKKPIEMKPMFKPSRNLTHEASIRGFLPPAFTADQLYNKMMNPKIESKNQIMKMTKEAVNRLQNIWIWNGRPMWDEIFSEMKSQRQHKDIGVCFCGAPVIGADLKTMCEKYSSVKEDVIFTLHKENF